jgi:hypothetical protein
MRRAALLAAAALVTAAPAAGAVDVSWSAFGTPGAGGWYVSDVWINWTLSNVTPPLEEGCNPTHLVSDTPGATASCNARDASGTTTRSTTPIKIDRTPPAAEVSADRAPDAGGFYNHPLTVVWSGSDATSGIATCTSTPYTGPDATAISLAGTCQDRAGNVSAPVTFAFSYDATPPVLANVRASSGSRTVTLAWDASGATRIVVTRDGSVVYDGTGKRFTDRKVKRKTRYAYAVRALDQAGNVASRAIRVTPGSVASSDRLLAPRSNAQVRHPPLLRWREVKRATYYNVQVFRGHRKVLSAWPTRPRYQLRRTWRYAGHHHRLVDATYRWYLWAGYGKRSARHYGRLLGKRSFRVR